MWPYCYSWDIKLNGRDGLTICVSEPQSENGRLTGGDYLYFQVTDGKTAVYDLWFDHGVNISADPVKKWDRELSARECMNAACEWSPFQYIREHAPAVPA